MSATADKVDYGVLLFRVGDEEIKNIQHILNSGEYDEPNYSHWVYKNRGNPYDDIIIWTKMNLGNMREECLFITDLDYNLLDIPKTKIDLVDDENKNISKEDIKMVESLNPDEQNKIEENVFGNKNDDIPSF